MKFKIFTLFLLCSFVIAEDYEDIDLSESKKKLSNEQKTDHDRKIAFINCFGVQRCLQFEDQMARS